MCAFAQNLLVSAGYTALPLTSFIEQPRGFRINSPLFVEPRPLQNHNHDSPNQSIRATGQIQVSRIQTSLGVAEQNVINAKSHRIVPVFCEHEFGPRIGIQRTIPLEIPLRDGEGDGGENSEENDSQVEEHLNPTDIATDGGQASVIARVRNLRRGIGIGNRHRSRHRKHSASRR